ncbi:hypothetical protein ACJX0J_012866 [Zea mays]
MVQGALQDAAVDYSIVVVLISLIDKKHLNLLWLYNTLRGWAILVAGHACIHLRIKTKDDIFQQNARQEMLMYSDRRQQENLKVRQLAKISGLLEAASSFAYLLAVGAYGPSMTIYIGDDYLYVGILMRLQQIQVEI